MMMMMMIMMMAYGGIVNMHIQCAAVINTAYTKPEKNENKEREES